MNILLNTDERNAIKETHGHFQDAKEAVIPRAFHEHVRKGYVAIAQLIEDLAIEIERREKQDGGTGQNK